MLRIKLVLLALSTLVVTFAFLGVVISQNSTADNVYRELAIFSDVVTKVRDDYVEYPDMDKAMQGALHGLVEALDPYSSLVEEEVYDELTAREEVRAGVGLVLSKRYGFAYIVGVEPGGPADRTGLRTGDLVDAIDGRSTNLMSPWEVENRLLGPAGSELKLRIIRSWRGTAVQDLTLTRQLAGPTDVSARIVEQGIGYVRIPKFREGAAEAVSNKLKLLMSSEVKGVLVDVREVSDGLLTEASAVADLFLEKGKKIGTIKNRNGGIRELVSLSDPIVSGVPILLLIDGGTSGAAEVFASALKDNGVAETLGEQTNGEGSIQEAFHLNSGSVLILSTELIYRPGGEALQNSDVRKSGLKPDVRSPGRDFVTAYYFDHGSEEDDEELDDSFYRQLHDAIEKEQLDTAIIQLRERIRGRDAEKAA